MARSTDARARGARPLVVVRGQDGGRLLRAGKRDDGAAVRRLERGACEGLRGLAERDLTPVEAEDAIEAGGLLDVVRGDHDAPPLGRELQDELVEQFLARQVDNREGL